MTGVHVVNLCCLQENSLVIHSPIPATHTLVLGELVYQICIQGTTMCLLQTSCNIHCLLNSKSLASNFLDAAALSCLYLLDFFSFFLCFSLLVQVRCLLREPMFVHIGQELTGCVDLKANERFVSSFACVSVFYVCVCVCVCMCVCVIGKVIM